MKIKELLEIANYDLSGGCLCGHGESCAVCSRSDNTRRFERLAKELALDVLKRREGIVVKEKTIGRGIMARTQYFVVSE